MQLKKDGYQSLSPGMGHRTEAPAKRNFCLEFAEILRHGQAESLRDYYGKWWQSEAFTIHRHSW